MHYWVSPADPEPVTRLLNLRLVRHRTGVLDKFLQAGHDRWPRKKFAENLDFSSQLLARNGLDKFFCGSAGAGVEFRHLGRSGPGKLQRFAFRCELCHQPDCLRAGGVYAATSEQQIAHKSVAQVALQARNPAEPGDQPETK